MKTLFCLLVTFLQVACADSGSPVGDGDSVMAPAAPEKNTKPSVLVDGERLDEYVGKVVTLRGEVFNAKIPSILGVDVSSDDPDLRGQMAEATGLLQRWVVTEEELVGAIYAHRGAGVFYRLKDPNSNYSASVRAIKQSSSQPVQQ